MAKQHYCFLERFNNYFNRKVIRYESLSDYQDNAQDDFIPVDSEGNMTPFDFNPNDNITTEIIANGVPFDPDYFLLLDANGDIVSRWFVLEQKRNRQGQWLYFLRRDVLADSYNELAEAPLYVEKGIISDITSPLLTNNEELRVNQIKKEEILLKDKSACAWLVMYLKKGVLGTTAVGSGGKVTLDVPKNEEFIYETLTTPITTWSYYQYVANDYKVRNSCALYIRLKDGFAPRKFIINANGQVSFTTDGVSTDSNLVRNVASDSNIKSSYALQLSNIYSNLDSELGYKTLTSIMAYNDKIIKDSLGKYYRVNVVARTSYEADTPFIASGNAPTTKGIMNTCWNSANASSQTANDKAFKAIINYTPYRIVLQEITDLQTEVDFSAYTGGGTTDSMLFDAICMPYGEITEFIGFEVSIELSTTRERSLRAMNSIATQLTSQYVLDFQLLPYCPVQNVLNDYYDEEGKIAILDDAIDGLTVFANNGGAVTDAILVCPSSNITFDIEKSIAISDVSDVPDTYKIKYLNDCTLVRLCSPNYNGLFDMNIAKNGGKIKRFNVDVTLRPFNPYIHVNPEFDFLYGEDFNDARGLICGGDFSLGIINDAWNTYEIQNKNYQAIFDRQIQNLDINNAINMQEAQWGAVAGTVQGASAGAIGGAMVGGGYGAVAGAAIGGVASGIGGAMDVSNVKKRQEEARSYAIDNYNLQLGNVRALPYSITKTSALTFNNKLFPFVEIYECSEEEKEAYYLKLKYNGMTVGRIDIINSYKSEDNSNYFRAKLIRLLDISEDNHYVETINEELMKGVFI